MPRRKVYHLKRIKKKTHRALVKRDRPRQVTKAQIRRRFATLLDSLRRDILRFQRSRSLTARQDLLRRIASMTEAALKMKPRSHLLRDLRKECDELLAGPGRELKDADLSLFLGVGGLGSGKLPRTQLRGPRES